MNSSNNNNNSTATPMELGAINQHKPLTQAVKDFRKNNQLCLYCGGKGHFNNNCPNKKKAGVISLILEGANTFTDSIATAVSGKRSQMDNLWNPSSDVGEVKNLARSVSDSILLLPVTLYYGYNEEEATITQALVDSGAIHSFISYSGRNKYHNNISALA